MIAAAAISVAVWIIFSAIAAPRIGRALREAEPPPIPEPEPLPVIEVPADATAEELETAVFKALFVDTIRREFPQYKSAA